MTSTNVQITHEKCHGCYDWCGHMVQVENIYSQGYLKDNTDIEVTKDGPLSSEVWGLFVWEQLVKPSHYSRLPKTIFPCSNLCCESWYCKIISTEISFPDCYEHLMPSDRSYRKHSKEHNHMLANDVLRAEVSTLKNEEPWFYITNFTIWLASVIDTSLSGIGKCPTNVFYWTRSLRQVRTRLIMPR